MFAYIKGCLEEKSTNYVVIDVNGIGYKIFMSNISINEIGEIGDKVKVHTHYYVREDNISLYGFLTHEELKMFELLLSVSGIGAKSAIAMLSNITPAGFACAIISNNVALLKKIPGIGPKTAQRIILELQDKLKSEQELTKAEEQTEIKIVNNNENVEEAMQALQILGYNKKEIEKAFEKIANTDVSVEELIKKGLSILAR
ncbi:MAG: Holliday junction branch migration protein RuvA [Clostridia bacterium]|nr:Holliday junction branch migration protein RuvA [Clostridia bacterium]